MPFDVLGIDASRAATDLKTGTEWYSREIIRAIAALDDRPTLRLYLREQEQFVNAANMEWVPVRRRRLWTHAGLALEIQRSPVDVLFVPSHVVPWRRPDATVVTIHDLGYRFERRAHTTRRRAMLELTTRWNVRRAARIIVPSEATRRDLKREYAVDPARVDVIPHGVDHERFRPLEPEHIQATLDRLRVQRPYLLFVSTLQPRKNLIRLVSAFETLDAPQLKLVIAGADGWLAEPIRTRIEASPRRGDIHRLGYVADDDLPALYNGAAAFVLPSLYEGFGMGVLEAMACGCPVVTSSVSSLPEVAGDAAILVDPRSAVAIRGGIVQALDPTVAADLRERGLRRAAEFTWDRAATMTLETLRNAYAGTEG